MANSDERDRSTTHAEGQHGAKTHERVLEQLHSRGTDETAPADADQPHHKRGWDETADGKHRLLEDREQHDDAERPRNKD